MEETRKLTYGEKAVGLTFNPSNSPEVDECKKTFAKAIDQLNDIKTGPAVISGEMARLISIAITQTQIAQMCAVKALTWKD